MITAFFCMQFRICFVTSVALTMLKKEKEKEKKVKEKDKVVAIIGFILQQQNATRLFPI